MKLATSLRALCLAATALCLPLLAGCDPETRGPKAPTDPGTPLYAIITQLITTDDPQSYVILTDKVDHTEPLSLDEAIELPGRALGAGTPRSGSLFVSGNEAPTVTRYDLASDGSLQKAAAVSFAGRGVASIGEYQHQFQFVSETKAYYFDGRTAQAIIWNPTDMSVTGSIDLGGLTVEGALLTFATLPVRHGEQLIMPVGWRPATGVGITRQAAVVVVDTRTDTAVIVKDSRCGYVRDGVMGPDGQLYLATEVYGSAVRRVAGGETPVPCMLRFNPETQAFDPSFHVALDTLVGGATAGSLLPGPEGTAYLRVLDESLYTVSAGTHPRVVASAPAWRWWQLRLDTLTVAPAAGLPASTGSTFLFQAGERVLFTEFASGSTATSLRELTDQSGKVVTTLPGISFSFLQLR